MHVWLQIILSSFEILNTRVSLDGAGLINFSYLFPGKKFNKIPVLLGGVNKIHV